MCTTRLEQVELLSAAMAEEIAAADPAAITGWRELPDVAALVRHVGFVHRWVTAILERRAPVPDDAVAVDPGDDLCAWFEDSRRALLIALAATPPEAPCWVIGGARPVAGFWRRRMVVEHVKHLIDLRAAGGRRWTAAPELPPAGYADGIDELFEVMLPRTRSGLVPLPGPVLLTAGDAPDVWRIDADWSVARQAVGDEAARIDARVADLALALWERADPVGEPDRFRITGDPAAVVALGAASIHPW